MERRAEAISGEFNSQGVANTLWAFAKLGTKPGERMMGQLERRAESISGEFNWVSITQIMWFYARTKGKPSETLLPHLEQQALLLTDTVKTHHLIMLFWAYATLKLRPRQELWALFQTQASKAANTLRCEQLCTFLWSVAVGGAALDISAQTYQRMCERTEELADVFDNEQQSMLIWTSVILPVVHGANITRIMQRDVLGILSRCAPPGTYSSSDLQSGPSNDSAGLHKEAEKGPAVVVSKEFANFQVGDHCECFSSIGEVSGLPVWQPGTNLNPANYTLISILNTRMPRAGLQHHE
jgi:hypothetical protein